jgi:iron-sulfur cluster assembly protein
MNLTLTEKAIKEIKHIMTEQNMDAEKVYARVGVRGGGCAGFSWLFTLDETYDQEKDLLIEQDGLKIVADKRSSLYIDGTTVDFHDALDKRGFSFSNPNAKTSCGCGSSFSM